MSWLRGRPTIRHIVSFTSVMAMASSTVTRPSTEASIRPRLYARSSASCDCRRAWSVMSRALAKIPRTAPAWSLKIAALNDTMLSPILGPQRQLVVRHRALVEREAHAVRRPLGVREILGERRADQFLPLVAGHAAHGVVDVRDGHHGVYCDQAVQ